MRSLVAIALGLVLAVSGGSALAAPAAHGKRPVPAQGRHEGKDAAKFPMPAAAFKQKVDARLAKARQHMEARAAKLSADQAKELRAKFDAGAAKVNAEVAKVIADGTVTKEEAKQVRQVSREMHPHRGGKHARGNKGAKGQGKAKGKRPAKTDA